jgi:hypothetical protein
VQNWRNDSPVLVLLVTWNGGPVVSAYRTPFFAILDRSVALSVCTNLWVLTNLGPPAIRERPLNCDARHVAVDA